MHIYTFRYSGIQVLSPSWAFDHYSGAWNLFTTCLAPRYALRSCLPPSGNQLPLILTSLQASWAKNKTNANFQWLPAAVGDARLSRATSSWSGYNPNRTTGHVATLGAPCSCCLFVSFVLFMSCFFFFHQHCNGSTKHTMTNHNNLIS